MISPEAQKTIEELFAIAGITRVISLDDAYANEYPVEHAIAYSRLLSDVAFTRAFANHLSGPASADLDIRANALREKWQTLTSEQKRQAMEALGIPMKVIGGSGLMVISVPGSM